MLAKRNANLMATILSEQDLREDILAFSHRWYLAVLAFLIGCLIGWGVSFLLPAPHRAVVTLSVAYNADAIFRNPDDYKNWQLQQLNALATAPDVLQDTLLQLRQQDPFWNNVPAQVLLQDLQVAWRNTGLWRLSAQADSPARAAQVVKIWSQVFLERYQQAYAAAAELAKVGEQLSALNVSQYQAKVRLEKLTSVKAGLQNWRRAYSERGMEADRQPLDMSSRWKVFSFVAHAAGYDPAWKMLLDQFPPPQASFSEYLPWLDRVLTSIETERSILADQVERLEPERAELEQRYLQAAQESRGLSATVIVTKASNTAQGGDVEILSTKPGSILALIGGLVGLGVWVGSWSLWRRGRRQ